MILLTVKDMMGGLAQEVQHISLDQNIAVPAERDHTEVETFWNYGTTIEIKLRNYPGGKTPHF